MRAIKINVEEQRVHWVEGAGYDVMEDIVSDISKLDVIGQVGENFICTSSIGKKSDWCFAINGIQNVFHNNAIIVGLDENFKYIDPSIDVDDIYVAFISNKFEVKPSRIINYEMQ